MKHIALLLCGCAMATANAAYAQAGDQATAQAAPAETESVLNLEEIVVTATARRQTRLDSSITVSSLDQSAIAEAAPRTTAEIFRSIPGVRSESTGGDGNANIAVRGLPIASGGAKFLQLQEDGLPNLQFGDIAFGNADIFLRADQTISSIQAVRGGSTSTLASNAPGGIINFISKDGSDEGGLVAATVGLNYEEYRLDFNYGGSISENTRFNFGGFWREGEGPREAGFSGNSGYQIKANITREFERGYLRINFKRLDDRAIGYLPAPTLVTGTNDNPSYRSPENFDILKDTLHSVFFTTDAGLDGENNRRTTDITDGMRPIVSSIGFEGAYEISDNLKVENRFRWSDIRGRFVSPFPSSIDPAQNAANAVGALLLTGDFGGAVPIGTTLSLQYANGPNRGQRITDPANLNGNGQVVREVLFNTEINDFGGYTNDLKLSYEAGPATFTFGFYKARQTIDMDWTWNSYLLELKGNNAALLDVVNNTTGQVLTQNGLYAYGVPAFGNCCQRSYDVNYDINAPYIALGLDYGGLNFDGSLRYDAFKARGNYAATLQVANFDVNNDGIIQPVERSVSTINNGNPQPVNYDVNYLSWSFGLNYRIQDTLAVFGRASRGGRSNADRLLFGVVQPDGGVRRDDAIDFVKQYEVGVKYKLGPLTVFATGFRASTQEQNFEATTQRFFNRTYLAHGLELESAYSYEFFDIRASATWTRASIAEDQITPQVEGNRPRRQAKFIYQVTPAVNFDYVRSGFNIIGTTRAFAQDNNELVLPGYAQVNAFLNVTPLEGLELSINANNVFNTVGITEAEEGSIIEGANNFVRARSINGRTISATVKYSF